MQRLSHLNRILSSLSLTGGAEAREALRPRPEQVRKLLQIYSVFRWGGGFAILALAAVAVTGGSRALLAALILWVAAYNGIATYVVPRLPDQTLARAARLIGLLDIVSYFVLLSIFGGSAPGALYACYAALLIPAVAFDGTLGALLAVGAFVVGLGTLNLSRLGVYGTSFPLPDFLLWSVVIVILAASLAVTQHLLTSPAPPVAASDRPADPQAPPKLSKRELEVLQLVAAGYSNTMIASSLHLSDNTVKGYVESLLMRLHSRNRAEAVAAASRLGLI